MALNASDQLFQLNRVGRNTMGTDFFVGDLHGCRDTFDALMAKRGVSPEQGDRVFCVGDLIDRGPDSRRCLSLLEQPWFFAIVGNHELMMLDALEMLPSSSQSTTAHDWLRNGGKWGVEAGEEALVDEAHRVLAHMSTSLEVEVVVDGHPRTVGVIHSDVTSERWGEFNPRDDVWDRHRVNLDIQRPIQGVDRVVAGHTIHREPRWYGNLLNIDTGAFHPEGRMTMVKAQELFNAV